MDIPYQLDAYRKAETPDTFSEAGVGHGHGIGSCLGECGSRRALEHDGAGVLSRH